MTLMSPAISYDRNGSNNRYIVIFFSKVMKANPSKHGEIAGVGLHSGITPKSSHGHLNVKSAKKGENINFLLFLLQL